MSAGRFKKQAEKVDAMACHGLDYERNFGYAQAFGLKKGLRRGRRRLDHEIVTTDLNEALTEKATPTDS